MPGAHRVAVSLGKRSRSVDLKVAAGESRAVDLSLPPLPPLPPVPATPERARGAGRASNEALFYTGLGVGAVGLGLAVGFGEVAIRARGEAEHLATSLNERFGYRPCTSTSTPGCAEPGDIADRVDTFTAISLVGLSAVVAGGVMVTYAIVQPHGKASERGVQAAFMGAPGGGGMMFMGRF